LKFFKGAVAKLGIKEVEKQLLKQAKKAAKRAARQELRKRLKVGLKSTALEKERAVKSLLRGY